MTSENINSNLTAFIKQPDGTLLPFGAIIIDVLSPTSIIVQDPDCDLLEANLVDGDWIVVL
jgi:hypothetical protein